MVLTSYPVTYWHTILLFSASQCQNDSLFKLFEGSIFAIQVNKKEWFFRPDQMPPHSRFPWIQGVTWQPWCLSVVMETYVSRLLPGILAAWWDSLHPSPTFTVLGDSAFSRQAPRLWNSLHQDIRHSESLVLCLKTHFFSLAPSSILLCLSYVCLLLVSLSPLLKATLSSWKALYKYRVLSLLLWWWRKRGKVKMIACLCVWHCFLSSDKRHILKLPDENCK